MSFSLGELADFIVDAKKRTYASQGDEASVPPLLSGSRQLEYRRGRYIYRDIYFGFAFFAGQETVAIDERPIWSMVYAGGMLDATASREQAASLYAFLRHALRLVDTHTLFRGPRRWEEHPYVYDNEFHGSLEKFSGEERIFADGHLVYELRYHGGLLR